MTQISLNIPAQAGFATKALNTLKSLFQRPAKAPADLMAAHARAAAARRAVDKLLR